MIVSESLAIIIFIVHCPGNVVVYKACVHDRIIHVEENVNTIGNAEFTISPKSRRRMEQINENYIILARMANVVLSAKCLTNTVRITVLTRS